MSLHADGAVDHVVVILDGKIKRGQVLQVKDGLYLVTFGPKFTDHLWLPERRCICVAMSIEESEKVVHGVMGKIGKKLALRQQQKEQ